MFLQAASDEFVESFFSILESARPTPTLVLVYQDNLDGIFSVRDSLTKAAKTLQEMQEELYSDNELSEIYQNRLMQAVRWTELAQKLGDAVPQFTNRLLKNATVAPFYSRSEVTLRLQEFINDLEQGVFLRLFIDSRRYQAEQVRGLFTVLERYFNEIERLNFTIDLVKSDKGVTYVFKLRESGDQPTDLTGMFDRFEYFMKICEDDTRRAEATLASQGFSSEQSSELVSRFAKDYKRLLLDSRHEFERKVLSLKHQMESEINEGGNGLLTPGDSVFPNQPFTQTDHRRRQCASEHW